MSNDNFSRFLAAPSAADDKYSRGVLGFVTGSSKYPGAAVLGVSAAISCGIGMVRFLGSERAAHLVLNRHPEVVNVEGRCDSWVFGSGFEPADFILAMDTWLPAEHEAEAQVVDAGALLAFDFAQPAKLRVLTPHAGELATLLHRFEFSATRDFVTKNPGLCAAEAARLTASIVLLKGNTTCLADPAGNTRLVGPNSPHLASAGSGDVLAGLIGALLATNLKRTAEFEIFDLLELAINLHSRAGQLAAEAGPVSAMRVAEQLRTAISERWVA